MRAKAKTKKQRFSENMIIVACALVALGVIIMMDRAGVPRRWHAAVFGTAVTFGTVALMYRLLWQNLRFWLSFSVCFAVHLLIIFYIFTITLAPIQAFGFLLWLPIALSRD